MCVAKTKAAVTMQLISAFFLYMQKKRFCPDAAHLVC